MSIKKFTAVLSAAVLYLSALTSCEGSTDIKGTLDANTLSSVTEKAETSAIPDSVTEQSTEFQSPVQDNLGFSAENDGYDVDLTILNGTMVYAQVYDIISHPENYNGKSIRMHGPFAYFIGDTTGKEYFAVLINDATACCAQGIEFVLAGDYHYPDDYPEINDEITVSGICDVYEENGFTYCQLLDAVMTTE